MSNPFQPNLNKSLKRYIVVTILNTEDFTPEKLAKVAKAMSQPSNKYSGVFATEHSISHKIVLCCVSLASSPQLATAQIQVEVLEHYQASIGGCMPAVNRIEAYAEAECIAQNVSIQTMPAEGFAINDKRFLDLTAKVAYNIIMLQELNQSDSN